MVVEHIPYVAYRRPVLCLFLNLCSGLALRELNSSSNSISPIRLKHGCWGGEGSGSTTSSINSMLSLGRDFSHHDISKAHALDAGRPNQQMPNMVANTTEVGCSSLPNFCKCRNFRKPGELKFWPTLSSPSFGELCRPGGRLRRSCAGSGEPMGGSARRHRIELPEAPPTEHVHVN